MSNIRLACLSPATAMLLATALNAGDARAAGMAEAVAPTGPVAFNMTSRIVSSPVSSDQGPKFAPSAIIEFQVIARFSGEGVNFNSFSEAIPPYMALYVGNMAAGYGPIMWETDDPGIWIDYKGLSSLDDGIEFSADGGKNFNYVPDTGAEGFNKTVTNFRIKPSIMQNTARHAKVIIKYRMRVE